MIESNRGLKLKRSAVEADDTGFTLIELLIVIVVLGILAAIVVFALSGVTGQSTTAACQSDAKTVGIAVAALQAENPTSYQTYKAVDWSGTPLGDPTTAGNLVATKAVSGLNGAPFLQSWPTGNTAYYKITVAGTDTVAAGALSGDGLTPTAGDVIVTAVNNGNKQYDATVNPVSACQSLG